MPGRRTARRDLSSQRTVCAGILRHQRDVGVDRRGLDAGRGQLRQPRPAARCARPPRRACGRSAGAGRWRSTARSMSSVSCSSSAKGTARASFTPLPGGSSGSASRICVAGASATTLAVRAITAARLKGPRCFAAIAAPGVVDAEPLGLLLAGCGKAQQQCVRHVVLGCSERAQQRRHLAALASIQKTVQGEFA